MYCRYDDGQCGAADQTGACEIIPDVCTEEFAPVCGCDDQTYANTCFAAAAGVSVVRDGECEEDLDARICGGLQGVACEEGEYCHYEVDALCGAADQTGACEVIPDVCTEEFAPVCGCDDRTYANACFAAAAGVSVQSEGECP
ncbi:MAG: serine protease [Phycisphaerae bacterium]|nr:serine protease [Phycisphaerae bacterium]